ncbi:PepSY domain-containing protein [Blastococcus sp. CT_GayMR19]|uniref:PepSY domain-containing protein n=1 Tax=Blastococcus sp. CT_GayMR19 TaxID=2559608 RepID=UPI001ADDE49A|nr:PepSY domain-containing protein [Blastococcus sp. CT_GayMR19]
MAMFRSATVAAAATAVVLGGGIVAAATAAGGSDSLQGPDVAITDASLQRAGEAALAETGGGRVTDTEVRDEESFYEVEVTMPDGRQLDVQLDESFAVVRNSPDGEKSDAGG